MTGPVTIIGHCPGCGSQVRLVVAQGRCATCGTPLRTAVDELDIERIVRARLYPQDASALLDQPSPPAEQDHGTTIELSDASSARPAGSWHRGLTGALVAANCVAPWPAAPRHWRRRRAKSQARVVDRTATDDHCRTLPPSGQPVTISPANQGSPVVSYTSLGGEAHRPRRDDDRDSRRARRSVAATASGSHRT